MVELALQTKLVRVNLGSGQDYRDGYINVDKYDPRADIQADILELPFDSESVDEIVLSHVIEHISWRKHTTVLEELHRVLKPGAKLEIMYPEFERCVENFFNNKDGNRWKYWVQTLYGQQIDIGQYHVAPMVSGRLTEQLREVGFEVLDCEEDKEDTKLTCKKIEPLNWF